MCPKSLGQNTDLSGLAHKPFSFCISADTTTKEGYGLRSQKIHSMLEDLEMGRMLRRIILVQHQIRYYL